MKKNNKVIIIGVMIIAIILISIVGTYAYFLGSLGETVNEELIIKAGTMQLVFRDTNDLVTNIEETLNFGDTVTKEFEIENTGTLPSTAKISWDNLVNTYLEKSLSYKLEYKTKDSEDEWKNISLVRNNVPRSETPTKKIIVDRLQIPSGVTYLYRVTIKLEDLPDIDQTQDLGATLSTKFTLEEGTRVITSEYILDVLKLAKKEGNPDFSKESIIDETSDGLYAMEDDYGKSYYFRGAVENNYVKFGTNANGEDMWWRIIRINGDGSIRMQYDGTNGYANGVADTGRFIATDKLWNDYDNDAKYGGWMFGGTQGIASSSREQAIRNETSSSAKIIVDEWYKNNILDTGYHKYIGDEIFCNDRSTADSAQSWRPSDTTLGFGSNITYYGGYSRFFLPNDSKNTNPMPSLKCSLKNDRFTVDDEKNGNGDLTYPVGLITVDEINLSGTSLFGENVNNYIYKGSSYFTMSPATLTVEDKLLHMYYTFYNGGFHAFYNVLNLRGALAPVVNIDPDYAIYMRGDGTIEKPYILDVF